MNNNDIELGYLVKYALSDGIQQVSFRRHQNGNTLYANVVGNPYATMQLDRDIFVSLDDAIQFAEALRQKKIISLIKQLEKLRSKKIKVTTLKAARPPEVILVAPRDVPL